MCGIAGAASLKLSPDQLELQTRDAVDRLRHRGPDGQGVWLDPAGVALGHARLSILDLSTAASQPMASRDSRWVLTYNGEVYNFLELGLQLEQAGVAFRSSSDTEVLVESVAHWGFEATLPKLVGMFAFAAWDRLARKLYLVRDRLGQKPLFYGLSDGLFIFGSELQVVKAFTNPSINPEACALMLRYKSVPSPYTIYQNFHKLPPGHWLEFDLGSQTVSAPKPYWQPRPAAIEPDREELKRLLTQAVSDRLVSDVPLGAFLSGGIDSSLVVATMQKAANTAVKTFTIGFSQSEFDEAHHAREVARHLQTDHTELFLTPRDLLDVVPQLPKIYDEPFGDSSQIPTILVSRLAREKVTVALSGDGGDEAFAGYNRHVWLPNIHKALELSPQPLLNALRRLLSLPATEAALCWLADRKLLPVRMVRDKLDKMRSLLTCRSYPDLYRQAVSDIAHPEELVPQALHGRVEETAWSTGDPVLQGCLADLAFYLPNDILVKVDRASMSCGLEARSPFLDHRLLEYALALPTEWKASRSGGKLILKELLRDHLPSELFERPKMGFAVPLDGWLKNELKEWGEDLLHSSQDLVDAQAAQKLWRDHQEGRGRHHHLLWNVLMLLSWMRQAR